MSSGQVKAGLSTLCLRLGHSGDSEMQQIFRTWAHFNSLSPTVLWKLLTHYNKYGNVRYSFWRTARLFVFNPPSVVSLPKFVGRHEFGSCGSCSRNGKIMTC